MEITVALERYERHVPFFTGEVTAPPGITLKPLEIGETAMKRHGMDRHRRMLAELEFDVCEMALGSYVLAASRDADLAMVGIPVFPRRYFSMSQVYVNASAGIDGGSRWDLPPPLPLPPVAPPRRPGVPLVPRPGAGRVWPRALDSSR